MSDSLCASASVPASLADERRRERIADKAEGFLLAAELERVVCAHLQPDMDEFNLRSGKANMRRVRQFLESRKLAENFDRDAADLSALLGTLADAPNNPSGDTP